MCDISASLRRTRYKTLRSIGYKRGFAQRARDFTDIRYEKAINRNMNEILTCNGEYYDYK